MILLLKHLKLKYAINKLIQSINKYNQINFKMAKIRTPDKKSFSNQIMSRELFLCAKNARKILLKVNDGNGMTLLSRNSNIEYTRNKLISYKSHVMWKT